MYEELRECTYFDQFEHAAVDELISKFAARFEGLGALDERIDQREGGHETFHRTGCRSALRKFTYHNNIKTTST